MNNSRAFGTAGVILGSVLVALGIVAIFYANWSGFFRLVGTCHGGIPNGIGAGCLTGGALWTAVGQFVAGVIFFIAGAVAYWRL